VFQSRKSVARCFTLLEGLVSIVLLGLILIGTAPFFSYGVLLIHRSSLRRDATELAAGRVEDLLDEGFFALQQGQGEETVDIGGVSGTMTTEVENTFIDADGRGYKLIRVTVAWTVGNKADQLTAATYLSSPWSAR